MKENRLTIVVNRPTSSVFSFTTEPDNTPLWIESIVSEKVNERLNTIKKNKLNEIKYYYTKDKGLEGAYIVNSTSVLVTA